ncbi:MAG TPA: nitrate/sulfonate/bicarbonate ABC transporter ATP-binding protein [Terriglobales bacterium]|nr:nitrate/sulfonate/bicarbonate ABC transporter ATP-binding protein [Terriglobales bacterium]
MTEPTEPIIRAHAVEKFYLQPDGNRIEVIAPVDLDVEPGKIITLLGPSGCGKSTLLRILTGLSQPSSGEVLWHGQPITSQNAGVAIVFQSFALFPWLTVLDNVEAPLEARGVPAIERHKRALRILDTVGLDGFESAYPKELSGGMKQRVGFARALVVEPEVLFMDEPFSALDVLTAENLRNELLELWLSKKMPTSAIFIVTHNIEEAVLLADRVIVLARNPAWVRADFPIELAHPRDRKSPRFVELVDYIYKIMTQPQLALPVPAAAAAQKRVRQKYQMLPHARVGGIAGLLELLQDRGGKEYLHRLAEVLIMDAEDLLPIIEASVLLGFATLKDGDVQITAEGAGFAEADILTRKILFRQAALNHVMILQQIDSVLHAKADHSISQEFFDDILDEHFSEDEVRRQFDTAMNWGRYAEIFDFDRESHRLILAEPVGEPHPPTTPVQS